MDKPGRPALPQWALWEPMGPGQPGQARPAGFAGDEGSRKVGMTTSWYQAIETQGYSHMATSRRSTKPGIGIALRLVRRKIGMALVIDMGGVWAKCALWPLLCRSKQVKQVSSRAAIQSSSPPLQMTISMIIDLRPRKAPGFVQTASRLVVAVAAALAMKEQQITAPLFNGRPSGCKSRLHRHCRYKINGRP